MKKVYLENLPRKRKCIDWINSIGYVVYFVYENIKGDIKIIDFNIKTRKIKLQYNNFDFEMYVGHFMNCNLGAMLKSNGDIKIEYKKDHKRQLKESHLIVTPKNFNIIENINPHKTEFTYNEMMTLVQWEKAIIKYQYNRIINGVSRMLVFYNDDYYIQCTQCQIFKQIDKFTTNKNNINMKGKSGTCKICCKHINKQSYYNDYKRYIYYRYKSLEQNSNKRNVECLSFEDFKIFAETNKDPVYNMTLKESFESGMYDKLDVDHKIPISKGGSSLIDNLYLIPSEFNRLKLDKTLDETLAIIKLLYEKSENIKQFYNTEEVKL